MKNEVYIYINKSTGNRLDLIGVEKNGCIYLYQDGKFVPKYLRKGSPIQVGDFEDYSCLLYKRATKPEGSIVKKWLGESSREYKHESTFSDFVRYENGFVEENPNY